MITSLKYKGRIYNFNSLDNGPLQIEGILKSIDAGDIPAQPEPPVSKRFKPYNYRLIPVLERAIANAKIFNLTTRELEVMISDLRTQELNLFEMPLD